MSTLVIQSCSEAQRRSWMAQCLASVEQWTGRQGFEYLFIGDEIFQTVPEWYLEKVGDKLPVATDLGRLILIRDALKAGYDEVVWFDADLVIFDPALQLLFEGSCAFGQEVWIQSPADGRLEARRNVHNAVCVFRQGCPVLPFLIYTVESLIRRVAPDRIAPQMVGPRLLSALHSLANFPLLPQIGALSPVLIPDLVAGQGPALDLLRRESRVPLQAANVSASLNGGELAKAAVAALLRRGLG